MFDYLTRDPENPAPLDFFSFHLYATTPGEIAAQPAIARELLDRYGYIETETILNEWNYVRGWGGEEINYSYRVIPSLKGSAFVASTILSCQKSCLDHLMYYDAALPAVWNGLFDKLTFQPLKPYYALYAFSRLFKLGLEAACTSDTASVYPCAAVSADGSKAALVVTYYEDCDSIDGTGCTELCRSLRIDWSGFASDDGVRVTYHLLDASHNCEAVSEELFFGSTGAHILQLPMYTTVLVTLEKC